MTKIKMMSTPDRSKTGYIVDWLVNRIPNFFERWLSFLPPRSLLGLIVLTFLISIPLIVTPLEIWQQGIVALFLMILAWLITVLEQKQPGQRNSEYLHFLLIWISTVTTLRYLYYRLSYTINLEGVFNAFFSLLLLAAELYAIMTLFLAYFQTIKLKERTPIDISNIPESDLFKVDVYIPTYNEDVDIVRKTALGALAIDYPALRKRVYVLDDGRKYPKRREKLQQMCDELGCTLMTRDNNDHAKAGNINAAMRRTDGDLILILDCDHIPTHDILKNTVGFFLNPNVSIVQTPHWFYNPDPFERNLLTEGQIPVGNELFYKVLQKGNDFWNASFFCGSAAVLRKDHVLSIGGIAVETVTEDCHTSFRLHSLGRETIYYDKIMVAGLAPETFSAYVGQQVRWARGMAQILRLENPLFNRQVNLTLPQRICYFSATSHFFFGFPRLVYAITPALFFIFGINSIRGLGLETLFYALPHILIASFANYIPYKNVRFSFWNELYEFAMSYHAGIVTTLALINPKLGSFNVTAKGVSLKNRLFDWQSSKILIILATLITISILVSPFWLIVRPEDIQAILINLFWSLFNLILVVAAILVAFERPQKRRAHRLARELKAMIYNGEESWEGVTKNISETGCQIILMNWQNIPSLIELEIIGDSGKRVFLEAQIIQISPLDRGQISLAVDFINVSQSQFDNLCIVLYSDVNEWYSQKRSQYDDPFKSFSFIVGSLMRSLREPKTAPKKQFRKSVRAFVQLYLEGGFYAAQLLEIDRTSVRLKLIDTLPSGILPVKSPRKQPVGIIFHSQNHDAYPHRLLAQIEAIEVVEKSPTPLTSSAGTASHRATNSNPLANPGDMEINVDHGRGTFLELGFPRVLNDYQGTMIRQLIRSL